MERTRKSTLTFELNGRQVCVDGLGGEESLLDVLRERCGVTSAKDGCAPEGSCGACTVLVDGTAVVSCAQPAARLAGRGVTTLEGLGVEARDRWADSFVAAGASQCGFCSPGIVMKAESPAARAPRPDAGRGRRRPGRQPVPLHRLRQGRRRRAARRGRPPGRAAAGRRTSAAGSAPARRATTVGSWRWDVNRSSTTWRRPGMLHGAIRFSDHPRARVLRIDPAAAVAAPGVHAVVTAADVPGERVQGELTHDWPHLVAEGETTRYVGDVLVLVAADDQGAGPRRRRARRRRVRRARAGHRPGRGDRARCPAAAPPRARQRAVGVPGGAWRRRRRARRRRARPHRDLPHPAHRARLPGARVGAGLADAGGRACTSAPRARASGASAGRWPGSSGCRRTRCAPPWCRTAVRSAAGRTWRSRVTPRCSPCAPDGRSSSPSAARRACASTSSATR